MTIAFFTAAGFALSLVTAYGLLTVIVAGLRRGLRRP
jgi:hypothetical protein